MKLSFGTIINDQPNYFIEKIWKGLTALSSHLENDYFFYQGRHIEKFDRNWEGDTYTEFLHAKLHTIRKDSDDLWHPGTEIIMVIYKDTTDEFQFTPALKCTGTQQIEISYATDFSNAQVRIDGVLMDDAQTEALAINDGFNSTAELLSYFSSNFNGKLVHWTPMKY